MTLMQVDHVRLVMRIRPVLLELFTLCKIVAGRVLTWSIVLVGCLIPAPPTSQVGNWQLAQ